MLAGCFGSDDDDPKTYAATVRYTSYGVPHVKADNFNGAGYGYGYAFAKDNVCTFAEVLVTLRGERAQYFGESSSYLGQLGDQWGNLDSDFFYRLL
ncbi:MAG: penicillin acylase family protein, partial [Burkholderiaceae bacterium]|nr:penicillin acylase family protein [Burkholderiaceae bacterium]